MNRKLAVLGTGSAGIQSLCHFLSWLNGDWTVTSIHDPNISIVGVGESTNDTFVESLFYGIDFSMNKDLEALDATIKFCTHWKDWREQTYDTPLLSGKVAIHFNTFKLREFVLPRLHKKWGSRFSELQGTINNLTQDKNSVTVEVGGFTHQFDYVIDCRGFPKSFDNYTMIEEMPLNHCIVHQKNEINDWKYTLHEATPDGWMFGIPLTSRTSYGYLFNNNITDFEQAKINFSKQIGVDINNNNINQFKFQPYYSNQLIEGRILKNGNTALFFEPMFANSIFFYDAINRFFMTYLYNGEGLVNQKILNDKFEFNVNMVKLSILYFYHGGSNYDTEFWKRIKPIAKDYVLNNDYFNLVKEGMKNSNYLKNGYDSVKDLPSFGWFPQNLINLDKVLGYNYWT